MIGELERPLRPIPLFDLRLDEEDIAAVLEVLRSGELGMGVRTEAFERAFANHVGARHAVALSSGTAALHIAYLAAGVGPGDEVIVPSYTFAATANAVSYCGGTPVFADIAGLDDLSISVEEVERLITPRTRAVTCVHFAGYPAAVERLASLCAERGVVLIEDAAHAPLAAVQGRSLGTWGLAGAFSLFSNKVLSVGEGGMLVTDDEQVADIARRARSSLPASASSSAVAASAESRWDGINYRTDDLRSALALSRLKRLDSDVSRRQELTRAYRRRLSSHPGVSFPFSDEAVQSSSCYVMALLLRDAEGRDRLRTALRERHGVQTSVLYPPVHLFTIYRRLCPEVSLPITEAAAAREVTIPLFAHLEAGQLDRVVCAIEQEAQG